jgi:hypothetical protein
VSLILRGLSRTECLALTPWHLLWEAWTSAWHSLRASAWHLVPGTYSERLTRDGTAALVFQDYCYTPAYRRDRSAGGRLAGGKRRADLRRAGGQLVG